MQSRVARILLGMFVGLLVGGGLGLWYANVNIRVSNYGWGIVFVFVLLVGSILGLIVGCIIGAVWPMRPRDD